MAVMHAHTYRDLDHHEDEYEYRQPDIDALVDDCRYLRENGSHELIFHKKPVVNLESEVIDPL